ncbi:MAG: helix-turn-helix transcriptional regulator, partial [Pseudonocardiales bacterium]|nr:helix-turn-helix transcriptional regulator [Pseudonocardiales bacterium]
GALGRPGARPGRAGRRRRVPPAEVELTPDPAARAARALDAAHATHAAGGSETALELLAVAAAGPLDAVQETRGELLRARITYHTARGGHEIPRRLVEAARTLVRSDVALARDTFLEAFDAALVNGDGEAARVAASAAAAPGATAPARPADLLLDGLVTTFATGNEAGTPPLRLALEAFRDGADGAVLREGRDDRWLWLAGRLAVGVLDADLAHALGSRHLRMARALGSLETLPAALSLLSTVAILRGELALAGELTEEATAIAEATGAVPLRHGLVMLAAWRGDCEGTTRLTDVTLGDPPNPPSGGEVGMARYALAVVHNGLGNWADAQAGAERASRVDEPAVVSVALPELVEAAVRAGHPDVAAQALERFDARARACGTPWALGLAARCRAVTSTGPAAEGHHRDAIDRLGASRMAADAARAHLVYGEWLRREGRRRDAREQLRTAHGLLSDMGAAAFAGRAARELRATGEHPRERTAQPADALTAHEAHIARLVATGATSREVASQLFLSPRTVEAHLRSIFRELGITSRRQLRELRLP